MPISVTTRSHTSTRSLVLPPDNVTSRTHTLLLAGVIYIAAWLIGLFVAAVPDAFASSADVHASFSRDLSAALTQSLLVHGVAGVALGAWVTAAALRIGRTGGTARRIGMAAGLVAAVLSWAQVGLMVGLVQHVHLRSTVGVDWAFDMINRVDTAKLLALGLLVASYTAAGSARRRLPRWLRGLGVVLGPLLPLSGTAFLVDSDVLTALLYASLPLLLVWVSAVTATLYRIPKSVTTQ